MGVLNVDLNAVVHIQEHEVVVYGHEKANGTKPRFTIIIIRQIIVNIFSNKMQPLLALLFIVMELIVRYVH